ncbi:MAG: hypothetical protein PHN85_09835 [Kiritimatiellae bacterium]|nr:hypothetical protein [Kiritimatiellia bacterium]
MTGKPDPKEPAVCEEVNGDEMQGHEPKDMDTELDLLSDRARASGAERIENVARLLSPANLKECLGRLKSVRNLLPLKDIWKTLKAKLSGHFRYFGVSGNYRGIRTYYSRVLAITLKWLNRRSFSWKTYGKYLERYPLPKTKIHHDFYGFKCLFVNVTEEPYVGNPQVRFCEGC